MKISIITICFNSEKTIEETIKSVVSQNYDNLEYIIIDGGSTDNTLKIIDKYKNRISKVISEPDNGISDAFNKGIKNASGDLIGIINSDDLLNEGALNKLSEFVKNNPDFDIYYGNCTFFDNIKNIKYVNKPNTKLDDFLYYMVLHHPSVFINKSAYKKYGLYDIKYKCAMDYELLSKMYFEGARFIYIDYSLSYFRLGGVSRNKYELTQKESIEIAMKNGCSKRKAEKFYKKVDNKRKMLNVLTYLHLEKICRKIFKNQQ